MAIKLFLSHLKPNQKHQNQTKPYDPVFAALHTTLHRQRVGRRVRGRRASWSIYKCVINIYSDNRNRCRKMHELWKTLGTNDGRCRLRFYSLWVSSLTSLHRRLYTTYIHTPLSQNTQSEPDREREKLKNSILSLHNTPSVCLTLHAKRLLPLLLSLSVGGIMCEVEEPRA